MTSKAPSTDHRLSSLHVEGSGRDDRSRALEKIASFTAQRKQRNSAGDKARRRKEKDGIQRALASRLSRAGRTTPTAAAPQHVRQDPASSALLSDCRNTSTKPQTHDMPQPIIISTSPNFVVLFFAQFPRFRYDMRRPIMLQFHELHAKYCWTDAQGHSEKDKLCTAVARQFNAAFGTGKGSLASWQTMCRILRITPIPSEIDGCQSALQSRWFDPWLIVESSIAGDPPTLCESKSDLQWYLSRTGNKIPKDTIQAQGGTLQELDAVLAARPIYIENYFAQYPQFRYDRYGETWRQFFALRDFCGWDKDPRRLGIEETNLREAIVEEFNAIYGTDENDLFAWQTLCREIRIDPIPLAISGCRKEISRKYVNLVDLVDGRRTGISPTCFQSEVVLSKYTRDNKKFFPRSHAKAGGLLRHLLRHINFPHSEGPHT